ncbi:MAG: hypothetical protein HPY85_07425 [Anaerolineae bacterium]|nr:hypothetical protein [Anaerolineae bacterium]
MANSENASAFLSNALGTAAWVVFRGILYTLGKTGGNQKQAAQSMRTNGSTKGEKS